MNAMQVAQRMTADEYLAVPYDGIRTMLVEGEVILNQPGLTHQLVLAELFVVLHSWATAAPRHGLVTWPIDVKIDDRNVFGPDLLWYSDGRMPQRDDERPYPLPDLAVEVRSPSTWRYDIGDKKAAYERASLPELWLVDTTADEVFVFRRSAPAAARFDVSLQLDASDALTSPQLPGFSLALSSLFAD